MKVKSIRIKKDMVNGYDLFIEVELDNGEYIFCNDCISEYRVAEKAEDLESFAEDFAVTNISILDIIDDDEKYEYVMCNFDKYKVPFNKDIETYNQYLRTLLWAWKQIK